MKRFIYILSLCLAGTAWGCTDQAPEDPEEQPTDPENPGEKVDPCKGITCGDHGSCVLHLGKPECLCDDGYLEDIETLTCYKEIVEDPAVCEPYDCAGHGYCVTHLGNPECMCDPDYYADDTAITCIAKANACDDKSRCAGGTCKYNENKEPYCECPENMIADDVNLTCTEKAPEQPVVTDPGEDHLKDDLTSKIKDYGKACKTDDDCEDFCDSFIGNKCSARCDSDEDCDGDNICRSDGRCTPSEFVTRWKPIESLTVDGTTYTNAVVFPFGNGTCNYTIHYSDGEVEEVTKCPAYNTSSLKTTGHIHSFKKLENDGLVTIRVSGKINNWTCASVADTEPKNFATSVTCDLGNKCYISDNNCCGDISYCVDSKYNKDYKTMCENLVSVESFGPVKLAPMAFYNAQNLVTINDVDIPDSTGLNSLLFTFYNNKSLTDGRIGLWDTRNVKNMRGTFYGADKFNTNIDAWNTSNVTQMKWTFHNAKSFNQPLNNWNTSKVTDMQCMFINALNFNQPLNNWDTSNVTNITFMFQNAAQFNGDITTWNTSKIKSLNNTFLGCSKFNQPIGKWDVSNVTNMVRVFYMTHAFNQPLNDWNVSNVTDMQYTFYASESFNQPLDKWNVSNVKNMMNMFDTAKTFNQPLNSWNTSNVVNMGFMFRWNHKFNQDISKWDTSNVTKFDCMFYNAWVFNKNVSTWNTRNAKRMVRMFYEARAFNQDLSAWNIDNVSHFSQMFTKSGLSEENKAKMMKYTTWKNIFDNMEPFEDCDWHEF